MQIFLADNSVASSDKGCQRTAWLEHKLQITKAGFPQAQLHTTPHHTAHLCQVFHYKELGRVVWKWYLTGYYFSSTLEVVRPGLSEAKSVTYTRCWYWLVRDRVSRLSCVFQHNNLRQILVCSHGCKSNIKAKPVCFIYLFIKRTIRQNCVPQPCSWDTTKHQEH